MRETQAPEARLVSLLQELYCVVLSTGTIENRCRQEAQRIQPAVERLRYRVLAVPVACLDETCLRVVGTAA